jgi:hypothetical protein
MVNAMVQIAAWIATALNNKSLAFNKAVVSTTYRGLAKGYSFANIVWLGKQVAHETAWGTSMSMDVDNNAWGMNCVHTRETTQTSCREAQNEVLGQYRSIDSSCADRFMWDAYWGFDADKRSPEYGQIVSSKYHTSDGYAPAVAAIDGSPVRTAVLAAILIVPVELFILFQIGKFFKK